MKCFTSLSSCSLSSSRHLTDSSQRVMIFHERGPNCEQAGSCPPGFYYFHEYVSDTEWKYPSKADILNTDVSCLREQNTRPASRTFFQVNNFVTPPKQDISRELNSINEARTRMNTCSALNNDLPVTFAMADFWSEGDLPRLAQEINAARGASTRFLRGQE